MNKSKLELITTTIDQCSKDRLENLFYDSNNMTNLSYKVERINECLNNELNAYGIKTFLGPDLSSIYIDDNSMCQILEFFNQNNYYQSQVSKEQIIRLKDLAEFSNKIT